MGQVQGDMNGMRAQAVNNRRVVEEARERKAKVQGEIRELGGKRFKRQEVTSDEVQSELQKIKLQKGQKEAELGQIKQQ